MAQSGVTRLHDEPVYDSVRILVMKFLKAKACQVISYERNLIPVALSQGDPCEIASRRSFLN